MSGLSKIDLIPGWDCYDWRNARTILEHGHSNEWRDIIEVLNAARLPHSELAAKGGSKTKTAASLDSELYKRGWIEKKFKTKIVVDEVESDSPIVDGGNDNGIDAIHYDVPTGTLVLVQSKWSNSHGSSIDTGSVLKFVQGARDLVSQKKDRFNDKVQSRWATIEDALGRVNSVILIVGYGG